MAHAFGKGSFCVTAAYNPETWPFHRSRGEHDDHWTTCVLGDRFLLRFFPAYRRRARRKRGRRSEDVKRLVADRAVGAHRSRGAERGQGPLGFLDSASMGRAVAADLPETLSHN